MTAMFFLGWLAVFIAGLLLVRKFQSLGLFLARHRLKFAFACVAFFAVSFLAGCGPLTWLTDATQILPLAGTMLTGILTLLGHLGLAGTIATVITGVVKDIQDVEAIVAEYKQNPSTTLLGSIEAGTKAVVDNITQLLNDTGITNSALQTVVVKILTLFLTDLTSFQSMLPALRATAGETLTIIVPLTTKESKAAYNSIISTPTGDPSVDAALSKLPKL